MPDRLTLTLAVLMALWAICAVGTVVLYERWARAGFPEVLHWRVWVFLLPSTALVAISLAVVIDGTLGGIAFFVVAGIVGYVYHQQFHVRWLLHYWEQKARRRKAQQPYANE